MVNHQYDIMKSNNNMFSKQIWSRSEKLVDCVEIERMKKKEKYVCIYKILTNTVEFGRLQIKN